MSPWKAIFPSASLVALGLLAAAPAHATGQLVGPLAPSYPRFGGYVEFPGNLCSVRVLARAQGAVMARPAYPQIKAILQGFVAGAISTHLNYDDMVPEFASDVRRTMRWNWPAYAKLGSPSSVLMLGEDQWGNGVYVVAQKGGHTHWTMVIDPQQKIQAAYLCYGGTV